MKNRGYTLLEVLGVIVILAVLTTVVFPSLINFIKKSSDEIDEYSMKLISNAADLYIKARKDSYIEYNDNKYIIDVQDLIDEGNFPESIKKSDIENIKDKCIQVEYKGYKFNYELKDKGTCKQKVQLESICTLASDSTQTGYTAGAKYECKVDPNKDPYTFYILTTPNFIDTQVNLIMAHNINSDGTAGMTRIEKNEDNIYNLVEWSSNISNINETGPVTAMTFLHEATKRWLNAEPLNYVYEDRKYQGIPDSNTSIGYTSFISIDGIATITSRLGNVTPIGTVQEPLRARMPIYSGIEDESYEIISEKGEISKKTSTNAYLYENLYIPPHNSTLELHVHGYWTMSSYPKNSVEAWDLLSNPYIGGHIGNCSVSAINYNGVRPVISLSITNKLPNEYQQVEYIESTGSQYIEIDYVASNITNSKGIYQLMDIETGSMLFGSRTNVTENSYTFNWGGSSKPFKYYNAFYAGKADSNAMTTKEIDLNKHTFEKNGADLYIDNELISSREDMASKVFQTPHKMIVFGCNTNGTIGLHSKSKIFNLQFYDEDVLKIDLIPCYRKSDNAIGMYDTVNGKFYTNLGTGTFLKGKDI